jgi:hypothetical protein
MMMPLNKEVSRLRERDREVKGKVKGKVRDKDKDKDNLPRRKGRPGLSSVRKRFTSLFK